MKGQFKNIHKGETCVLIGNGPSLNRTPLDDLAKKYITFGSNQIYRLPFTPTYYSIIDEEMLHNCLPLPKDFNPTMFLRAEACVENNNYIYPINIPGFSVDIPNFVIMGGTVSYCLMQLAFYMGFKKMLLVGMDHYYPKSQRYGRKKFMASGHDPDHFETKDGKPYFLNGMVYNPPELDGVEHYYKIALELFNQAGVEVINLTPNTKLNVFKKGALKDYA